MSTLNKIFSYLKSLFPDPKTELEYSTPFQLVVAVILSAQTTDIQVNKVTKKIFNQIKIPQDLLQFWSENFKKAINSIWLYNSKSKNIRNLALILDKNNNKIPKTINKLKELPWIGEKTAKVILHVLYNKPVIAVDTHVQRVTNRLWIVSTKTAEQTSKLLEKIIPNTYKPIAHHSLILFWRYYCTARNPKCSTCKLQSICKYYQESFKKFPTT